MRTSIEWATDTLNPGLFGCSKVSEACEHCYAMSMSHRLAAMKVEGYHDDGLHEHIVGRLDAAGPLTARRSNGVQWTGHVRRVHVTEALRRVHQFRRTKQSGQRPRVFVTSMSDILHESIPIGWTASLLRGMAQRDDCDWMLLTKRASRLPELAAAINEQLLCWPRHVWVGVTAENQARVDERIRFLAQVPAAVRFVSVEPMVGPVDLTRWLEPGADLAGNWRSPVNWVIAGGESGARARPSRAAWFRNLRDQCLRAGVPFLFKQWGEWAPVEDPQDKPGEWSMRRVGKGVAGRELDGRTWDQIPAVAA